MFGSLGNTWFRRAVLIMPEPKAKLGHLSQPSRWVGNLCMLTHVRYSEYTFPILTSFHISGVGEAVRHNGKSSDSGTSKAGFEFTYITYQRCVFGQILQFFLSPSFLICKVEMWKSSYLIGSQCRLNEMMEQARHGAERRVLHNDRG